jgi:hypothetical protein
LSSCSRPFPELHGELVEGLVAVEEVVGADDGGVAADVAAADPALLEHGDAGLPELLGEVEGGGEAVAAAAHDEDVVGGLRVGVAPCGSQPLWPVSASRKTRQPEYFMVRLLGPSGRL